MLKGCDSTSPTPLAQVRLVPPAPAQLPLIRRYLQQLAEHDGVPHAKATEAFLRQTIFGSSPVVYAHLVHAHGNDEPCGLTVHSWKWGPFSGTMDMYLHVLFLDPASRGKGIGKAVVTQLLDIARSHGASRLELLAVAGHSITSAFYDTLGLTQASHMAVRRKACTAEAEPQP